jgi:hypothetical protein
VIHPSSLWNGAAAWNGNPALGVFARNTLKEQKDKSKMLSVFHATCPIAVRVERSLLSLLSLAFARRQTRSRQGDGKISTQRKKQKTKKERK